MRWNTSQSFSFQAGDGIRGWSVTGVQTCALPILSWILTTLTITIQGESRGIVMVSVVRIHDIVESERRPAPGGGRPAEAHPLARPCARHSRTELVVREDHVDDAWRCVPLKNIEMVGQVEARRLAGLRRDVADEDSE